MPVSITSTSHAVYHAFYHLVWSTKYRRKVLKGAVQESARSFLLELCRTHSYECHALEIMEDHIHLFISFGPRRSVADVVKE